MATSKLDLDQGLVESCRQAAARIAADVAEQTAGMTTLSVERTVARLFGVDGANELGAPLPNVLVDHVRAHGGLGKGVAYWIANAMFHAEGMGSPPARSSPAQSSPAEGITWSTSIARRTRPVGARLSDVRVIPKPLRCVLSS